MTEKPNCNDIGKVIETWMKNVMHIVKGMSVVYI